MHVGTTDYTLVYKAADNTQRSTNKRVHMASMVEGFTCVYTVHSRSHQNRLVRCKGCTDYCTDNYVHVCIYMTDNVEVLYTFGSDNIVFRCVTGQLVDGLQSWDD